MAQFVEGLLSHRVPEILSLRRNWVPPPPSTASECVSPPLGSWGLGKNTRLQCRAFGYSIPTKGTDTPVLSVYHNTYAAQIPLQTFYLNHKHSSAPHQSSFQSATQDTTHNTFQSVRQLYMFCNCTNTVYEGIFLFSS
jgi:hypothetical protein